jgi:hypothetical protein
MLLSIKTKLRLNKRFYYVSSTQPKIIYLTFAFCYNWGERIRTSEWLDQNQLPYHLATPQRLNLYYLNIQTG